MLQRKSQVLLLIEIDSPETRAILPGKLYEYLAAKRPIIALGPKQSDIEDIIKETASGMFFNYSDKNILKKQILEYYNLFKENKLEISSRNIEDYSRRELTKKFSELILD